jgi:hypothetical protein
MHILRRSHSFVYVEIDRSVIFLADQIERVLEMSVLKTDRLYGRNNRRLWWRESANLGRRSNQREGEGSGDKHGGNWWM